MIQQFVENFSFVLFIVVCVLAVSCIFMWFLGHIEYSKYLSQITFAVGIPAIIVEIVNIRMKK